MRKGDGLRNKNWLNRHQVAWRLVGVQPVCGAGLVKAVLCNTWGMRWLTAGPCRPHVMRTAPRPCNARLDVRIRCQSAAQQIRRCYRCPFYHRRLSIFVCVVPEIEADAVLRATKAGLTARLTADPRSVRNHVEQRLTAKRSKKSRKSWTAAGSNHK